MSSQTAPRLIAEIGINHLGQAALAEDLILGAASAGAWGVKFQYRNLASTFASNQQEIGDEIVGENIRRSYLSPATIMELSSLAKSHSLKVGISFFNVDDTQDFESGVFDFYKVPSAEFVNFALVSKLLEFEREVLVSVGMQTEATIEKFSEKNFPSEAIILMHCVSNYPTSPRNARLGYLQWLKEKYPFRVGYSSHDDNWTTAIHSLQFHPEVIERHITLDKGLKGTDQSSSSTVEEFAWLAQHLREAQEITSGNQPRTPNQGEKINRQNLGRGYYAKGPISAGSFIKNTDFEYRAPLVGLDLLELEAVRHTETTRKISKGEPLSRRHFGTETETDSRENLGWARENHLGLPARLHDVNRITEKFGLGRYEIHLSFGEVEKLSVHDFPEVDGIVNLHMPDYSDADNLLDPFSSDPDVRRRSLAIMTTVKGFAENINSKSGHSPVVVCSLSNPELSRDEFYRNVEELFAVFSSSAVTFSLQWLPPIAWYFGGSVRLTKVNSFLDAEMLATSRIPITMDLSHLMLGENSGLYDAKEVFRMLIPNTRHFHLSGASGFDGEGVDLDFSNTSQNNLISAALRHATENDQTVILETWQGHLDDFRGFSTALSKLEESMAADG